MASADKKAGRNAVLALSPFKYDKGTGQLVRGQVFVLRGHRNDSLLLGQDFVRPVPAGTKLLECGKCGATFMDEGARERHGRHFHDNWCACGWRPPEGTMDRDKAMSQHVQKCDVWGREREQAAERHLNAAMASA